MTTPTGEKVTLCHRTWRPAATLPRDPGVLTTRLANGKILALGRTTQLFDPTTGAWHPTAPNPLSAPPNDNQLIALLPLHSLRAEAIYAYDSSVYDARSNRWTITDPPPTELSDSAFVSIGGDKVLRIGGSQPPSYSATDRTDIFTASDIVGRGGRR